jgi:hypothetical protein
MFRKTEGISEEDCAVPAKIEGGLIQVLKASGEIHDASPVHAMMEIKEMTEFVKGNLGRSFK